MGALTEEELDSALAARLRGRASGTRSSAAWPRARARAQGRPARVHVKHDSGMGRLGNRDAGAVLALARACAEDPDLELAGVWTHFATADEPESDFFDEQLRRFARGRRGGQGRVPRRSPSTPPTAPPSSATRRAHFDMVRCGVAVYGLDPFQGDPAERGLAPALSLRSYVADVKRFERRRHAPATGGPGGRAGETTIGVLPIGYGDGVRRGLSNNAEVLVGGRRHPLVGTVSMDNVTIDLGPEHRGRGRRRGGPDRQPRARTRSSPRRSPPGSARSTTRSPAGSPRGCRARRLSASCREPRGPTRRGSGGRGRPRRRSPAPGSTPGSSAARSATPPSAAEVADLDLAVAGEPGDGGAGDRRGAATGTPSSSPPSSRPGGSSTATRPGRSTSAPLRGGDDRGRPRRARLHRRRGRRAARRRRADRPARRPRRPRAPRPARGRRAAASPPTRCACCARRGSPPSSGSSSTRRPSSSPGPRRRAPPSPPASGSWSSCAG